MARELADRAWCNGEAYSLGDIAAGCALGYLDLRDPARDWRRDYPNLARHAEKLASARRSSTPRRPAETPSEVRSFATILVLER